MKAEANDKHASQKRIEQTYRNQKPRLIARFRRAGRTIEEAEDLVQEVYAETLARLAIVPGILNLPAWIYSLFMRQMIDFWRQGKVRQASGEIKISEEALREIIAETGLDPQDICIRDCLLDALDDAIRALPEEQRRVIEAQVFGGKTFRELAESTGENMDTLMARKRYALAKLARALRQWIDE
ncbi:MAG: RNA polymerase sigma factor [Spirochaetes bacterium]|nr:RNA polymerase sigma factor [Spirochaetota bacterium]